MSKFIKTKFIIKSFPNQTSSRRNLRINTKLIYDDRSNYNIDEELGKYLLQDMEKSFFVKKNFCSQRNYQIQEKNQLKVIKWYFFKKLNPIN